MANPNLIGGILAPSAGNSVLGGVVPGVLDTVDDTASGIVTGLTGGAEPAGTGDTPSADEGVNTLVGGVVGGITDLLPAVDVGGLLDGLQLQVLNGIVDAHLFNQNLADFAISLNGSDLYLGQGVTLGGVLGTQGGDLVRLYDGSELVDVALGDGDDSIIATELALVTGALDLGLGNDSVGLGTGDSSVFGGAGDDTLVALGDGDNTFNGGSGADYMAAGRGNDTYYVDHVGDQVAEEADEGYDRVYSSIDHELADHVERLQLTNFAREGTGNALDNTVVGNAQANLLHGLDGNDLLNGGRGVDQMWGGAGDDIYYVDDARDQAIEAFHAGFDQVRASASYVLGAEVERLDLTGSAALSGTGNELQNIINGNAGGNALWGMAGDDLINGGGGADTMYGGTGNDNYIVNTALDTVVELAGEGVDRVTSAIGYTLSDNVESLSLIGTASVAGTGNAGTNVLKGNSGANILTGLGGSDFLEGGLGNDLLIGGQGRDTMTGGAGADRFEFATGDFAGKLLAQAETIVDFSHADRDRIDLHLVDANSGAAGDQGFAFIGTDSFSGAGQLRIEQSGSDLIVWGTTNNDLVADFAIRLQGNQQLIAADFVL
jgi:Ca2+-binding RTX toxin-like protein